MWISLVRIEYMAGREILNRDTRASESKETVCDKSWMINYNLDWRCIKQSYQWNKDKGVFILEDTMLHAVYIQRQKGPLRPRAGLNEPLHLD